MAILGTYHIKKIQFPLHVKIYSLFNQKHDKTIYPLTSLQSENLINQPIALTFEFENITCNFFHRAKMNDTKLL